MAVCVILPQPFFLKMGHGAAAWCLLHGLVVVWAEDPPGIPKANFFCWLCHASCAVLCCADYTMVE